MARLTPRKYSKLPWIRELVGARCEELARQLREERMWSAVLATPSAIGDILAVVGQAGEVPLTGETVKPNGVRERQRITSVIRHGQTSYIPREDGSAHPARAVVVPRLYGHRNRIIDQVRVEIHRRDGVWMSGAWIESCWDDFIALQNSLRHEED